MKKVTIERKKSFEHIFGREFVETYEMPYYKKSIKADINEAIKEFEDFHSLNGWELDERDQKDVENLRNLTVGDYVLDVGDFTYYITIE